MISLPHPFPVTLLPPLALGGGEGGLQLRRRSQVQVATLQLRPHPLVAPREPHRQDAPLRRCIAEAQLPHRVVEQAGEPAPQRQATPVDLRQMVQDVHFEGALVGHQAPGLVKELLVGKQSERSPCSYFNHT